MEGSENANIPMPGAGIGKPSELHVQLLPIDQVIPYARNPRRNESAVAKVAASIREFGWRQPIVVDPQHTVIAGHTRLLAARQLNLEHVPVHIAEGLSDTQIRAYRLADNRVGQEATWDMEMLSLEIQDLVGEIELDVLGFESGELEQLKTGFNFQPGTIDDQGKLDEKSQTICPNCGHEF